MPFTKRTNHSLRSGPELPPSGPLPRYLQTAGCRLFAYRYFEEAQHRFGSRFLVHPVDMPPLVFLSDPDEVRAVLTADPTVLHPGKGSAILRPLIGPRSFMLLEEDEHLASRRAINPAFHRRVVAEHTTHMLDAVEREVASWPVETPVALHPRIRSLTLRVILRAIFDERTPLDNLHAELLNALDISTSFLLQEPKLRLLPGWRRIWRAFVRAQTRVDRHLYALIQQRRRGHHDGHPETVLDLLIAGTQADGSPMTLSEVRDNLMSLILAGHETTTGESAWAFLLLAQHPIVQARVADEIGTANTDDYLTATINETMRRRPVFLFAIPRAVVKSVEIGGLTYRAPVHVAGCTYLMHHNPALFPRPYDFRPERFLEESPTPRTWLPWGGGKKHCLGRHFALLEVKTIVRSVLARYRVLPTRAGLEAPRWRSAILVPREGARVILRHR